MDLGRRPFVNVQLETVEEYKDVKVEKRLGGGYFSDVYRGIWQVQDIREYFQVETL
jgi:hypothetical protein